MSSVKSYFDKVSKNYTMASARFFWKRIRAREAVVVSELLPRMISTTTTAVDLGSGSGYYANILYKHRITRLTCIDFSEKMLNQVKNSSFVKIVADIEAFQSSEKYDIVLCAGTLEFIKSPKKFFANVSTMLNPGGVFILLCPSKNFLGYFYSLFHQSHGIKIKLYNHKELSEMADAAGFRTHNIVDVFPFSIVAKFTNA